MAYLLWISGLRLTGRHTMARRIYETLKEIGRKPYLLDEVVQKEALGFVPQASLEDQRQVGMKLAKLCQKLVEEGMSVICPNMALFHEVQQYNRKHISDYYEVYLNAPMSALLDRDQEDYYRKAFQGDLKNVMGVDLPFEAPEEPELVLENMKEQDLSYHCWEIEQEVMFMEMEVIGDF